MIYKTYENYKYYKIFETGNCLSINDFKLDNEKYVDFDFIEGTENQNQNKYYMILSDKKFANHSSDGCLRKDNINAIHVNFNILTKKIDRNNKEVLTYKKSKDQVLEPKYGLVSIPFKNKIIDFDYSTLIELLPCFIEKEYISNTQGTTTTKFLPCTNSSPNEFVSDYNAEELRGGKNNKYKKTDKSIKCGNQTRKIYLQGNTRYVKWGGNYEKLTALLNNLKNKNKK